MASAQARNPRSLPGGWAPSFTQGSDFSAAQLPQRAAMERSLQQIITLFRAAPSVAHPVGYCLTPLLDIRAPEAQWETMPAVKVWPAHAFLGITALNHDATHSTCINPATEGVNGDYRQGNAAFDIWVNDFAPLLGEKADSDAAGPMVRELKRLEDVGGFPVYQNDKDSYVVIAKRTEPLFTKVTRERLLRSAIASDRARLGTGKAKQTNPYLVEANKAVAAHLAAIEKLLADMPASERASQAVLGSFTTADDPFSGNRDMPLVSPNAAFFDRTRPAGDIQLLLVRIPDACDDGDETCPISRDAVLKALKALDWRALATLAH